MAKDKLKMSNKRFMAIWIPTAVILVALAIALTCAANYWSTTFNMVFGAGDVVLTKNENNKDWDAKYYDVSTGSIEKSIDAARDFNLKAAKESIVLLKNGGTAENPTLPLAASENKVNVFGWSFEHPNYGGTGSAAASGVKYTSPKTAFNAAGLAVNEQLIAATQNDVEKFTETATGRPYVEKFQQDWSIPEAVLTDADYDQAKQYSDVAVIWLTRLGGEGSDMPTNMEDGFWQSRQPKSVVDNKAPDKVRTDEVTQRQYGYDPARHYLELTETEETMIKAVKARGFAKVIAVINSDNPIELNFLRDHATYGIDACVWNGGAGENGFGALPAVLKGDVNPSGRTVDVWTSDFTENPTFNNFGDPTAHTRISQPLWRDVTHFTNNVYENLTAEVIAAQDLRQSSTDRGGSQQFCFQNYEEGVYVGYRYYETRFGADEAEYASRVIYPFGYGLSYTTFDKYISDYTVTGDKIEIEVTVTNTGAKAGKDVVEIYYSAPYGDETANPTKIEKADVVLGGFAKTKMLGQGESDTVTVLIVKEDMASYDDKTAKCYVLDDGDYEFTLRSDSHSVVEYNGEGAKTSGRQAFVWKNATRVTYDANNPRASEKYAHDEQGARHKAATNAFDGSLVGISEEFTNMSRADFAGTLPQVASKTDKTASDKLIQFYKNYKLESDDKTAMPVTGENTGLGLIDLRSVDYDDKAWETYLDQWTVSEMVDQVLGGAFGTVENLNYGKARTVDQDGPTGIKYKSMDSVSFSYVFCVFLSCTSLASTWNEALAEEYGEVNGEEALWGNETGWYAPGMNIHRSPFGGRNFEYYSEDPFLSGTMATATVTGAAKKGVYAYLKHFALNDEEYQRHYLSVWASEQTMREIYLKPFEMAVKNAKMTVKYLDTDGNVKTKEMNACLGVMVSQNRLGNTWTGANSELLNTVLREEWGFRGTVLTDMFWSKFWVDMNADVMIRNGCNLSLNAMKSAAITDEKSATAVKALRDSVHAICYSVVNSNAMNNIAPGTIISYKLAPWQIVFLVCDIIVGLFALTVVAWIVLRIRDDRKHPDKYKHGARV